MGGLNFGEVLATAAIAKQQSEKNQRDRDEAEFHKAQRQAQLEDLAFNRQVRPFKMQDYQNERAFQEKERAQKEKEWAARDRETRLQQVKPFVQQGVEKLRDISGQVIGIAGGPTPMAPVIDSTVPVATVTPYGTEAPKSMADIEAAAKEAAWKKEALFKNALQESLDDKRTANDFKLKKMEVEANMRRLYPGGVAMGSGNSGGIEAGTRKKGYGNGMVTVLTKEKQGGKWVTTKRQITLDEFQKSGSGIDQNPIELDDISQVTNPDERALLENPDALASWRRYGENTGIMPTERGFHNFMLNNVINPYRRDKAEKRAREMSQTRLPPEALSSIQSRLGTYESAAGLSSPPAQGGEQNSIPLNEDTKPAPSVAPVETPSFFQKAYEVVEPNIKPRVQPFLNTMQNIVETGQKKAKAAQFRNEIQAQKDDEIRNQMKNKIFNLTTEGQTPSGTLSSLFTAYPISYQQLEDAVAKKAGYRTKINTPEGADAILRLPPYVQKDILDILNNSK